MTWFAENWFWVLFGVGFIAMHFFGHGCHGGHGSHEGNHGGDGESPKKKPHEPGASKRSGPSRTQRH